MESKNTKILEALQMQPLSDEEKSSRHILGRLYGPIATTKEKTRNGRGYNKDLWEKALADDLFKEKLATKSLFLELGHPADREETDMKMVCACIPEMPKIVDGDLYAYVDILDTPNGKLLKTLCDYGFIPGISSRGSGDIMANDEVDPETFFLETWDIVQLPAVKKARLAMCESLNHGKTLKTALQESLDAATDKEKEVMKESLDNLNIELTEAVVKEEDVPYEDPDTPDDLLVEADIPVTPEEGSDDSSDDEVVASEEKIEVSKPAETVGELVDELKVADDETPIEFKPVETPDGLKDVTALQIEQEDNKVTVEVKVDMSEKAILPEETPVDNIEVKAIEEPMPEVVKQPEEAVDNGNEEVFESLKEMVRQKDLLEGEVKELKSQKTVSDAEVKRLTEELEKYKAGFMRVSALASKVTETEKANKALTESVATKDAQIAELNEKIKTHTSLTESLDAGKAEVKSLNEKLEAVISEAEKSEKTLNEQITVYRKKLAERTETAKQYKAKYEEILEGYIAKQAQMLAVRKSDITSRLGESYTLADIDKVCDDLLTESVSWSNLPFGGINRGQGKIQVKESLNTGNKDDDDGFDDLLELAGLK